MGNYVIEQRLGAGGFGEVYRAGERSPKRPVALKFLRPELVGGPDFLRRLQREVDAMARVEHPNVVPIYNAQGLAHVPPYFVMRYVPGSSLGALLDGGRLSLEQVVDVLTDVAEGLDFCHARGIVHRDLKPANVLVDAETGRALLTDFGIALTSGDSTLTAPGNTPGTRAYMAPETLSDGRATSRSDLWSLGAMAYRAATGSLPRGVHQAADAAPVPPSRRNDRLGPDVDRVLLRALSRDPRRRHRDACAFVADLREALERPAQRTTSTRALRRRSAKRHGRSPGSVRARRMWSVAGAAFLLAPMTVYGLASLGDAGSPNAGRSANCHPSYADACLKPDSRDYDCKGGPGDGPDYVGSVVRVVGPDHYGLDRDGDGVAC